MKLSFYQLQELSRLRTLPEFLILLDALQADIDDLADAIEAARTDEEERRAVAVWRALRICLRRLRGITDAVRDETEKLGTGPVTPMPAPGDDSEAAFLARYFSGSSGSLPDVTMFMDNLSEGNGEA